MSEEDNWRVYKSELKEVMSSKNLCVPFLGQLLTQIVQQETVNDLKSYRRKSRGRRPQSGELNSGSHETLSAPASPVNSFHEDQLDLSLVVTSPNTMNPPAQYEQKTSAPLNNLNHVENSVPDSSDVKLTNGSSIVERTDKLSPLPVGKFKNNSSSNMYRDSFKKSSEIPAMTQDSAVGQETLSPEDVSMLSAVDALKSSCDSLDLSDSSDSRGSTPPRDNGEVNDSFITCPLSPLDVSQHNVTPCDEVVRESTPVEPSNLNEATDGEANLGVEVQTIERGTKKNSSFGLKKKRWNSLKRKISSPIGDSSSTSCSDASAQKRDNKLHIYDMDGLDVYMMLQQMQFASFGYMNSLDCRQDIQCFIEGLQFNSEEENYHNSLEVEPNDQPLY